MHPQHLVFSCFLHPKWGIPRFLRQLQVRRVSLSSTSAYGIHPQDESSHRGPSWTKENMQDRWKFLQFLPSFWFIFLDKKNSSRNSWKFDLNGGFTRDHIGTRCQLELPDTSRDGQVRPNQQYFSTAGPRCAINATTFLKQCHPKEKYVQSYKFKDRLIMCFFSMFLTLRLHQAIFWVPINKHTILLCTSRHVMSWTKWLMQW